MRECLDEARSKIIGFMRNKFRAAGLSFEEEEAQELINGIEESIWNEMEGYRSITEVQQIVDCVRAGHEVNVPYYDPEIDDDPYIVRAKWQEGGRNEESIYLLTICLSGDPGAKCGKCNFILPHGHHERIFADCTTRILHANAQ